MLEFRETELFTRYDSVEDMASYLPSGTTLEAIRGAVIFAPAAVAFKVPVLATLLTWLERAGTASWAARYAGFVMLVARRT